MRGLVVLRVHCLRELTHPTVELVGKELEVVRRLPVVCLCQLVFRLQVETRLRAGAQHQSHK